MSDRLREGDGDCHADNRCTVRFFACDPIRYRLYFIVGDTCRFWYYHILFYSEGINASDEPVVIG